jgi:threonine/homoserine/homoserine lactone efflux protein
MSLTANTVYVPSQNVQAIALVTTSFGLISLSCASFRAAIGIRLKLFLTSSARLKALNYIMATLLIASLYPVLI